MGKIVIKTPAQIEGIRKAGKVTAGALEMIGAYIKPGVSTLELDNIINTYILKHGGRSATLLYKGNNEWGKGGYPRASCISVNEVVCHGIPSADKKLKEGDILNIDITTILDGYFGDASRMYTVGKVTDEAQKLIDITKECLEIGMREVRPGNHFGNIGYAISTFAEARGYSVVRDFTGHGVGIAFHEEPYVFHKAQKNSGPKMKEGMVFTIEPMINIGKWAVRMDQSDGWTVYTKDKSLSAQWEHTMVVTKNGVEILTK
ncbi:type I methionyl aminopeptidase [Candidatus Gracilibacteria bacterium]|nr:type I methionyl aminopeptidase [Candidatus Gracilibacteria bacterium]